jgi:hypothetical protein
MTGARTSLGHLVVGLAMSSAALAQQPPPPDVNAVAKATQNPVSDPETDLLVLQPFVNYNFGRGWALSFAPIINANWNAASGNQWTVPLGFGFTRTTVFDGRPTNVGMQYFYNVEKPDGSAGETLRFVLTFLYPKK